MGSDSPPGQLGDWCPEPDDFAFAFNDPNFSDRVLRIEIVPDIPEPKSVGELYAGVADWTRNRKRRRAESKRASAEDILVHHEVQFLNCNIIDTDDVVLCENQDEEVVAMIESPSDSLQNPVTDEAARSNDLLWSTDCSTILKVETLHISSPILAAKSPFFYKLFSNGMRESEQRQTTLKIHASEEAAIMDLLNFMYSNTLPITTAPSLLNVLKAADKFEVVSCMRYCSSLLKEMPMTPDSALLYLDLPSCVLMADAVQKLTDKAKEFLAENYKDISKHADEVLNLPLSGIEVVLSSDHLQITSEDTAYDVVLKWARLHYPDVEARREVIGSHLANLIRFPYLSSRKLRKVLCCNDFDPQLASKIVLEALFFKSETPFKQRSLAAENTNSSCRRFVERAYKYRPIKIVEFELPRPQCFVYLDLKRDECESMFPSGRVYSQAFYLCGQAFFLSAHCNLDQQGSFQCLGMFLGMQNKGADSFTVDYDFSVRAKPGKDFTSKYRGTYSFTGGKAVGYRNLLSMTWTTLMEEDCVYFIDSVLHLRAELTIKQ